MTLGNDHSTDERMDELGDTSPLPLISVVIPTIGRPELTRAIESVREQDIDASIEVVVVYDGGPQDQVPSDSLDLADVIVRTRGRQGGSNARNLGIEAARGQYVALLDDDDEWMPGKLRQQLALIEAQADPARTVVAGRHIHVDARTGSPSAPAPSRLIAPDEKVEEYLFRRRKPSGDRASMYTSTLLCARELAVAVPWDTSLKRHQDWDWTIRLGAIPGVRVIQTEEAVVRIQTGSAQSISASSDWNASLGWAERSLGDAAVRADFLTAQTLRYAFQARDLGGIRKTIAAIARTRRLPSAGPIVIGFGGVLPRRTIERITSRTSGSRQARSAHSV